METGFILTLAIGLLVAAVMVGIGIYQVKSRNPVTFYTGEKAPAAYELTDVHGWNKAHGLMWLIYGGIIALGFISASCISYTILCIIPIFGSICIPVPVMILTHHKLIKKYKKTYKK